MKKTTTPPTDVVRKRRIRKMYVLHFLNKYAIN